MAWRLCSFTAAIWFVFLALQSTLNSFSRLYSTSLVPSGSSLTKPALLTVFRDSCVNARKHYHSWGWPHCLFDTAWCSFQNSFPSFNAWSVEINTLCFFKHFNSPPLVRVFFPERPWRQSLIQGSEELFKKEKKLQATSRILAFSLTSVLSRGIPPDFFFLHNCTLKPHCPSSKKEHFTNSPKNLSGRNVGYHQHDVLCVNKKLHRPSQALQK